MKFNQQVKLSTREREAERMGRFLIRTPKQDVIFVGRARTAESIGLQQNVRVIPARDND